MILQAELLIIGYRVNRLNIIEYGWHENSRCYVTGIGFMILKLAKKWIDCDIMLINEENQ